MFLNQQNNGKLPARLNVAKLHSLETHESLKQGLTEINNTSSWDSLKKNIYEAAEKKYCKKESDTKLDVAKGPVQRTTE